MNDSKVFLDTSGLVALVDRGGKEAHDRAKEVMNGLREQRARFVTTDDVVVEASNLAAKHFSWKQKVGLVELVLGWQGDGELDLVHVDGGLFDRASDLMKKRSDKKWGLTDCACFVVMNERGIRRAFTLDKHFVQAGFHKML